MRTPHEGCALALKEPSRAGRQIGIEKAVPTLVPGLRGKYDIDLVIANVENSSGGFGIAAETAQEIFKGGVDMDNEAGPARDIQRVDRLEGSTAA